MKFRLREVIWAKVKGYPWWPAYVNKLPEEEDGNFKVFFFAEETYALLEPKCVQKFADNYPEYSKTKAKKFMKALEQANSVASSIQLESKTKKECSARKKTKKQKADEDPSNDGQSQGESVSSSQKQSSSSENEEDLSIIDQETDEIDRSKVEKAENQLSLIIRQMQNNRITWKHSQYFQNFVSNYCFNSEQLIHSNITRMIRYIIECMQKTNTLDKEMKVVENISKQLKNQVISYLTNTAYYDNHIKLFDRSKNNKSKIESRITKIMKKKYEGHVKKEFLMMLATNLGNEVGKKCHSQCKQLIKDLSEGVYDDQIKVLNSKAGCLRICDLITKRYE